MDNIKKKRKPKSKNYFTSETEKYIVLYNNSQDPEYRSKIYEKHIHYAFFKLTQNIIHTFKFYHTEVEELEHLQHEIITFLLSKIHMFDPSRGAKAYSYFGTIVKNWLILYNTKNYNNKIQNIDISYLIEENSEYSYNLEEEDTPNELSNYINLFVKYVEDNLYLLFPKKNDAQIADVVLELFRRREEIEIFNKKTLYLYIRETVDAKTPKITKITNTLYSIFKSQYIPFIESGYAKF